MDLLLDGLTERFTESYQEAFPSLTRALHAFVEGGDAPAEQLRWLWTASLYREAIERLGRTRIAVRAAHDTFSRIEAEGFAERARRELQATGEAARRRSVDTRDALTPQEAQIARLARDGLSNPGIGAQLFISPRTVQYHLGKVFAKLDITSRNQLARVPAARLGAT